MAQRIAFTSCLCCISLLFAPLPLLACLWDDDTLRMERQQFPTALELMTGKFRRHSVEFYRWRIKDRLGKLAARSSNLTTINLADRLAWLDDLAVAYDKTGQQDKAIETMLRKERLQPGLYETAANLGTFHIHRGELEKGLIQIERALEINPEAHFGREVYQKLLVEFLLKRRVGGREGLPLSDDTDPEMKDDFFFFIVERSESSEEAVKGVLGMMRFGRHDSPILLEAVGDLLSGPYRDESAKRLSARAYLKASYEVRDTSVSTAYRSRALAALNSYGVQTRRPGTDARLSLEELERTFKSELVEAEEWYAGVRANELRWIAAGDDVDMRFSETYFSEPAISTSVFQDLLDRWARYLPRVLVLVAALGAIGVYWFVRSQMTSDGSGSTQESS